MSLSLGSPNENNDDDGLMTAINTTPLIDVMLVLLVMLIITIPIQLHSVNMATPKNTPAPATTQPIVIDITINAHHQILWNGELVASGQALQTRMEETARQSTGSEQPHLHIHPNPQAKYENVAHVLATAQRAGLTKIGITDTGL